MNPNPMIAVWVLWGAFVQSIVVFIGLVAAIRYQWIDFGERVAPMGMLGPVSVEFVLMLVGVGSIFTGMVVSFRPMPPDDASRFVTKSRLILCSAFIEAGAIIAFVQTFLGYSSMNGLILGGLSLVAQVSLVRLLVNPAT